MNKYAGTQSEKNLLTAFAGESEARNKYTFFASVAKKQGFEQIAALFLKTADNEKEHAKLWFKELNGIGDTADNLKPPPRAKITNGPICMTALPRRLRKRASPNWLPGSAWWEPLKSITKSATAPCCTTLKWQKCLPKAK